MLKHPRINCSQNIPVGGGFTPPPPRKSTYCNLSKLVCYEYVGMLILYSKMYNFHAYQFLRYHSNRLLICKCFLPHMGKISIGGNSCKSTHRETYIHSKHRATIGNISIFGIILKVKTSSIIVTDCNPKTKTDLDITVFVRVNTHFPYGGGWGVVTKHPYQGRAINFPM